MYTLVSPISLLSSSNYLNQEYSHRFFNVIENGALVLDNLEITGGFLNDTILKGIIHISGKNAIVHMKNCIVYNHVAIGNSIILVENGATITIENSTFKNNVANNVISCSYSKCTLSSFSSIYYFESKSKLPEYFDSFGLPPLKTTLENFIPQKSYKLNSNILC